ncbi:MAG: DUF4238 domain-containing protein [Magnetococcales bacterium]|nr:DUF4238 domain-containing protein [Magnetococcales bacterium]
MSGRKQHYIPQFLLRKFAAIKKKKGNQVYVYTKEKCILTETKNIGAERDFYSSLAIPGIQQLDDKITNHEKEMAVMLISLLNKGTSVSVDADIAASFVTHLTSRTKFIRQAISSGFEDL